MVQNRRNGDKNILVIYEEIAKIKTIIQEIHQRQVEQTIPILEKLNECLYGNGKCGLIAEHAVVKEKLCDLESVGKWVKTIAISVIGAIITFAFGYGILFKTVEYVKDLILKHINL